MKLRLQLQCDGYGRETVLIVEDDNALRGLYRFALSMAGFSLGHGEREVAGSGGGCRGGYRMSRLGRRPEFSNGCQHGRAPAPHLSQALTIH